jgi:hypothetical protein
VTRETLSVRPEDLPLASDCERKRFQIGASPIAEKYVHGRAKKYSQGSDMCPIKTES